MHIPSRPVSIARGVAVFLAIAVVASAVAVAPIAGDSASAATSVARATLKKLNTAHAAHGYDPFLSNGFMQVHANGQAKKALACHCDQPVEDNFVLDKMQEQAPLTVHVPTGSASTRASRIAAKLKSNNLGNSVLSNGWDYAVLAIATGKKYTYAYFYAAVTEGPLLDRLTTATPTITGHVRLGSRLTAHFGSSSPTPTGTSYQWMVDGKVVGGNSSFFTPEFAHLGGVVTVKTTASRDGYVTVAATSKPTKAVAAGIIVAGSLAVSGARKVGIPLSSLITGWGPEPMTISYQWTRNGVDIPNATSPGYWLDKADLGKKIDLRVSGSRLGYVSAVKATHSSTNISPGSTATP